jgi:hypothetical protein
MMNDKALQALAALGVITRDLRIRQFLISVDPKALQQCEKAFAELEVELEPWQAPAGPRWTGCQGCGAGKGWIERNPALHEQNCGGVGKTIWERKGIAQ